jgi:Rrf2 family transcriptional regulator, nitric oxide-sensitive transcriptional repressor
VRLDLQTDYALRSLMYLGAKPGRAKIDDIATFFAISRPHVAKVVNLLARLGFIRSVRGVGGGIELVRDPATISVGEVIRAFEGQTHLLECVSIDNVCVIQPWCQLRTVLGEAERIQMAYLDSVRLADVLPSPESLTGGTPNLVPLKTKLPR